MEQERIQKIRKDYTNLMTDILFEKVYHYIVIQQQYLSSALSVEEVAQQLDVLPSEVTKSVQDNTGENFTSFLNHYRLRLARRLLLQRKERLSMEEISRSCGFPSRQTFYYAFDKAESMPPREWKKQKLCEC